MKNDSTPKQNEERAKTFTDEFDDWDLNGRSEEIIKFISRQVLSAERQARREMLKKRLVDAQDFWYAVDGRTMTDKLPLLEDVEKLLREIGDELKSVEALNEK
jgi:hypothetical protein